VASTQRTSTPTAPAALLAGEAALAKFAPRIRAALTAATVRSASALAPTSVSIVDARGEAALHFALAQLGKPYRYGGTGPNAYDCSGLTQRAWRAAGVPIPRTTEAQAGTGTAVPMSGIRPGDLVIFYPDASHVGIYAGSGKVVVAPHSGTVVTVQEMRWMPVHMVRRPA
jgi:cell wall-associated NlpC family hydrolase